MIDLSPQESSKGTKFGHLWQEFGNPLSATKKQHSVLVDCDRGRVQWHNVTDCRIFQNSIIFPTMFKPFFGFGQVLSEKQILYV